MNGKMLFMAISFSFVSLRAHNYESFTIEKTDKSVIVTIDTGKKVTADDIVIMHKDKQVSVTVNGLDQKLKLSLEASRNMFAVSMCSELVQEKKGDNGYSSFHGSSCMQQAMSVGVDLAGIIAEYAGTQLILSVPVTQQEQGKKIPVIIKQDAPEIKVKKNKKTVDEK